MVASQKALDALKTIGLNKYERNLWAALLSRGASTAGELSDISAVPRSRCYDVLETLANRGFVVIQPGKPIKYVAIQPSEALARAKKKIHEEAFEMGQKIERLLKSDALKELEKLHKENMKVTKPEDLTGTLKSRYAMNQQLDTMFRKAKKSIKLMTTESGLADLAENHTNLLKKVSGAGLKISILAPITKSGDIVKNISKHATIKDMAEADAPQGRMCLIDG